MDYKKQYTIEKTGNTKHSEMTVLSWIYGKPVKTDGVCGCTFKKAKQYDLYNNRIGVDKIDLGNYGLLPA